MESTSTSTRAPSINRFTSEFLDLWYLQTLLYTTQDQVSFAYVMYKMIYNADHGGEHYKNADTDTGTGTDARDYFISLPNELIKGKYAFQQTDLYIKQPHGL